MLAQNAQQTRLAQDIGNSLSFEDHALGTPVHKVSFRNVCKSYDGQCWVVKDLNLNIRRGEFVSFLGPSGSGKTTTLMMLAGFESPSDGDIILDGQPIQELPPEKRNIGIVFQNYALFPHLTVEENIAYPLRMRKLSKEEISTRVAETMRLVQLEDMGKRKPSELSGGQQQRVALARALVFEPKLVLMDEPLGALDKRLREDLQLEIKHICNRLNLTVVYVTHDQGEALTMSDRVAVFSDGKIQQLATPEEIYKNPANTFVATFVGENNKLNGSVERLEGDFAWVRIDSGSVVRVRATTHCSEGERCSVVIRPEKVQLGNEALGCVVPGLIKEFVYYGGEFRVHVDIGGGQEVVVRTPGDQRGASMEEGRKVLVGWKCEDAEALDYLP